MPEICTGVTQSSVPHQAPAPSHCQCQAAHPCPEGSWWVCAGDRMMLFVCNDSGRREPTFKHVEHVLDGSKNISRWCYRWP